MLMEREDRGPGRGTALFGFALTHGDPVIGRWKGRRGAVPDTPAWWTPSGKRSGGKAGRDCIRFGQLQKNRWPASDHPMEESTNALSFCFTRPAASGRR